MDAELKKQVTIEEGFCHDDADCSAQQYCYRVSERCVDYTQCSRYNRQENRDKRSRHPSQCGPCFSGYTAEELGTGEMAWVCKKTNIQNDVPDVGKLNINTIIIWTTISGVLIVSLLVMLVGLYIRRRASKRRNSKPEQCGDLSMMEPSAPPVESSPFISHGHIPFNNNKNLKDNNNLVCASGFKPPSWIRTNPNYDNNLNQENMTATGQLQSVVEITPTDVQSDTWQQDQLTVEITNGNLIQYEVEQVDNNTNTVLVQTNNPSSSNTNDEEDNNNNTSSNSDSSNAREDRERVRTSNILISPKISMNVNLLNID
ncbi:uncharacterized protein LOC114878062 isoform X1 [Osmia bicornis bicornis]|uniref:uncharacterized protein LOC114878062 isoform X1 n=1 Tax=Osmia bicornis bicornis TaxID=1437191 RepID=UPI001EAEC689|nr:uncharacterized protein LOC114878062 isoform X1 [Osmia bicornis bicornis]